MPSNPQLVASNYSHLNQLVQCHCNCFPNSLATKLGKAYVGKTIEWFLADNQRFIFHVEVDEKIAGYCGGFIPKGIGDGSSSGMLQYGFKEAVMGIIVKPWLVFNKEVKAVYPFIFRNIKRKIFKDDLATVIVPKNPEQYSISAGLVVICVEPLYRGTAVFKLLMQHFNTVVKSFDIDRASLSVKIENTRAINAYKKVGWQIVNMYGSTYVMDKKISIGS